MAAIGAVRLDNVEQIRMLANESHASMSQLELIVRAIERCGQGTIGQLVGDFAFAMWPLAGGPLIAARDALGVRTLFIREERRGVTLSDRATVLATGDSYDLDFVADYLAAGVPLSHRTMFVGVRAVPPGSVLTYDRGEIHIRRFWRSSTFLPDIAGTLQSHHVERFRDLFVDAIRRQMPKDEPAFAQLSGGVDS
jgi:asparagine synthase (glutamine-hydrolysing)